ncbi:aminoglycoside 3'-phosphotransferase [Kribbella sp. VKM Ac-2566]|uniref:aminoglycoside 3'-phosphotransferase n=1 Tax=Kribbella sp. VKM Ac-2566 TaxID=2512218 RepID=UPI00106458CB|nr:aminoglycoside 3'-phosphotransferase [Kribbella sp. VKM Ac-2566]TDW98667.1 streptomycin 3'-kinase [Kribbella sp. VKM Ac-2566]
MHAPPSDDWEPVDIGESDTSVYRRGNTFAKCCGPSGIAELTAERDRITWLASTGFPGATVVDWLEPTSPQPDGLGSSSGGACLVTSAVPGVPGDTLPPASHDRAMRRLGATLRELHSLTDCPFERPLAEVIARATDVVRRDAVNPAYLTDEWRRLRPSELLAQVVAERPYIESVLEPVVCHGDACLPNIFFDPETLEVTGLIDLGRLGVADRYSDLALTTIQLHDEWSADPAPFLEAYGVPDPDARRLYFFRLLDPLTWG